MLRLYLAGPMTGYPDYNRSAFLKSAYLLTSAGYRVVDPSPYDDPDFAWTDYLRRDLKLVLGCDGVAVLPNWQCSKGASLEVYVAQALDMPVKPVEEWCKG